MIICDTFCVANRGFFFSSLIRYVLCFLFSLFVNQERREKKKKEKKKERVFSSCLHVETKKAFFFFLLRTFDKRTS